MSDVVYAKADGSAGNGRGGVFKLVKGETWDAEDPVVKRNPSHFSDVPTKVRSSDRAALVRRSGRGVEDASAAPGKKRNR